MYVDASKAYKHFASGRPQGLPYRELLTGKSSLQELPCREIPEGGLQ